MIYVDQLFTMESRNAQAHFVGQRHSHQWCHLWCDPEDDIQTLHTFARQLGLHRQWFQADKKVPHYDLTPTKRSYALFLGAQEKSLGEWLLEQRAIEELL